MGGGAVQSEAGPALREFAREFGIPAVTTLMGIGVIDTYDPLSLRTCPPVATRTPSSSASLAFETTPSHDTWQCQGIATP